MKCVVVALALTALQAPHPTVVLQNSRVRAYRTTAGALQGVAHGPGVVVWLEGDAAEKPGRAVWVDDAAMPPAQGAGRGPIAIIQPLPRAGAPATAPPSGSKPGEAPFTGMSFVPQFENARVSVLRARMDVDARKRVHTHASDTIIVHLSGGEIEDTTNGKTVVNRVKPGDVNRGSGLEPSARNIGHTIDVVLVALKP